MHPFQKYCLANKIFLQDLALELGINYATLYRIMQGYGSRKTITILSWCRQHYIDPYEVFCVPSELRKSA